MAGCHSLPAEDPYLMRGLFTDESRAPPGAGNADPPCPSDGSYVSGTYATCAAHTPCAGGTCSDPEATTSEVDCNVFFPNSSISL